MGEAWRLAVGTLTALPVAPPRAVDRTTARAAMLLAPVAVVPLGALVVAVGFLGLLLELPPLATATMGVGVLAAGSRALHWDGLSDVADGLAASYEPERSLAVMKGGTSGPAGTVALVLALLLQVATLAALLPTVRGAVLAGALVCGSRCALALACTRGIPAARADGLGVTFAGSVPVSATASSWTVLALVVGALGWWAGLAWWQGPVAVAVAAVVVLVLLRRARARFGGTTGDVYGAAVELSLTALLLVAAAG